MTTVLIEIGLGLGIFAVLAGAWSGGARAGRSHRVKAVDASQLGVLQGATLGLLGLLLGFCFSGAVTRFVERQDIIVREANAATTLYQRAELLPEDEAKMIRDVLREYMSLRLDLFNAAEFGGEVEIQPRIAEVDELLWKHVSAGIRAHPEFVNVLAPAYTDVIDSRSVRNAAEHRHIPKLVLAIVFACAVASTAAFGYGVETSSSRLRLPALVLVLLIASTLWTIIDLDFPRMGLIRLGRGPLDAAAAQMNVPTPER